MLSFKISGYDTIKMTGRSTGKGGGVAPLVKHGPVVNDIGMMISISSPIKKP